MALFVNQNSSRSELQEKIAADLSERLRKRAIEPSQPARQPAIMDGSRRTSRFAWLWLALLVLAVVVIVWSVVR